MPAPYSFRFKEISRLDPTTIPQFPQSFPQKVRSLHSPGIGSPEACKSVKTGVFRVLTLELVRQRGT